MATTIILAATVVLISSRIAEAQEKTPPPRMLLNLDLFISQPADPQPGQADDPGGSMFEQLRALRAMGYLSPDGPLPDVDDPQEAIDEPPSVPTNDTLKIPRALPGVQQ